MGKGRPKRHRSNRLSEGDRGRAVGMREMGASFREIASKLGCSPSSVHAIMKKWGKKGDVKDLPKSGRPRKTTSREDRHIEFTSLQNRRLTGKAIALKHAPSFTKNRLSINSVKG